MRHVHPFGGGFIEENAQILSFLLCSLESSQNSEIDLLMDKLGGDTAANEDVEAGNQPKKSRRRRRILNNFFDFMAIVFSK